MPSYTRPEDRDYDAFTLYADVITESSTPPTGGTDTYPLLFENIGAAVVPPSGFLVPAPANYHLSIDYVN
ncbi:MAG: hypothetical protein ACREB9_01730, partial [Thermoplasmata archaeon]